MWEIKPIFCIFLQILVICGRIFVWRLYFCECLNCGLSKMQKNFTRVWPEVIREILLLTRKKNQKPKTRLEEKKNWPDPSLLFTILYKEVNKNVSDLFTLCLHYTSVGSNLVRFEVRFGFLRFGRFEVQFLGQIWRFGRFEVRFKGSANLSEPLWPEILPI